MRNQIKLVGLIVLLVPLRLNTPVAAGPLEDAAEAARQGNYETALELWRPLAEHGNATAQNYVGWSYKFGMGVSQDDAEAAKWFRRAADQGYAAAQWILGLMYSFGDGGLPQDYAVAVMWYRQAADQGLAEAQGSLGEMYANGQGVLRDYGTAAMWYRKSADQGNPVSQNNLGSMYLKAFRGTTYKPISGWI